VGRAGESYSPISISEKQKYFCNGDWTSCSSKATGYELICPSGGRIEPEGEVFLRRHSGARGARKPFADVFYTIFKTLSDLGVEFILSVSDDYLLGTYRGLDSPRHDLKNGDELKSTVLTISL
jgi:hypothetical protein